MKKILLSLFSACLLVSCSNENRNLPENLTFNRQSKIEPRLHWRIPWDANMSDTNFVRLMPETHGVSLYKYKKENLCLGKLSLDSVRYETFRGQLMRIYIYSTERRGDIIDVVKLAYGEPTSLSRTANSENGFFYVYLWESPGYTIYLGCIDSDIFEFESEDVVELQKTYLKFIDDSLANEKRKICPPNQYYK